MATEIMLEEVGLESGQIMADSICQWRSDCQAGQYETYAYAGEEKMINASYWENVDISM